MKYFLRKAFWGQKILALLDHELRKVINRNTVKASDSTMPNMEYNAKMWKKKMQRSGECSFKSLKAANFTVHLKKKRQLNAFHMKIHLQIHSPLRWSGEMPKNATNANMPSLGQAIWGDLLKYTVEKYQKMQPMQQAVWGYIWKRTVEKSQTNATNVTMPLFMQAIWGDILKCTLKKSQKMQPMRLCLLSSRQFEATFENVQCRKIGQMQLVWLCILPVMPFENTFEKTHWRKAKKCNLCDLASFHANNLTRHLNRHSGEKPKMQPMRLCLLSSRQFEATFENVQCRKIGQMQLVWLCILPVMPFENTFEKTHWRKAKKCNLCDLASFHANNLTRHLNRHSGEKPKMQPQRIWKIKEMLFVWLCILPVMPIGETFSKHTGEKPNNCKECDLASFQANSLTRHLNRHSGEKPNELLQICLLSGRHLRRLLKTQSGEKWTHM